VNVLKGTNWVKIDGKVTRRTDAKYLPSGELMAELTLAFNQTMMNQEAVGYIDVVAFGPLAEKIASKMKVGQSIRVLGNLWSRRYRHRTGTVICETKMVGKKINLSTQANLTRRK